MILIRLLIILLTVAVAGLFLFLLSSSKEYDEMISPLDEKEFMQGAFFCQYPRYLWHRIQNDGDVKN